MSKAESNSEKTYKENTRNSGTKMKAEKAGSKEKKAKVNEEKVSMCILDQYMRRIILRIII